jgi:hypothetical protein
MRGDDVRGFGSNHGAFDLKPELRFKRRLKVHAPASFNYRHLNS